MPGSLLQSLSFLLLIFSLPPLFYRLLVGPEWTDRILAMDLLGISFAAGVVLYKLQTGWPFAISIIWLILLTSFVGNLAIALIYGEHHDR